MPEPKVAEEAEKDDVKDMVGDVADVDENEDADLESGFSDAIPEAGKEEPAAEPVKDEPAPEVKYRQVTEDEWASLQAKAAEIDAVRADVRKDVDRAFGKMGGVERTLAELQKATPAGHALEVTDDVVAELTEAFPEVGALVLQSFKNLAKGMKGTAPAADKAAPAGAPDPEQLESTVSARLLALQLEALDDAREDWREVIGAPDDSENAYRKWLKTQSPEYQARLAATNSAAVISRSLDKFDSDKAKAVEQAAKEKAEADAKAAAEAKAAARRKVLGAADAPKGAGGHGHEGEAPEDQLEAGFKS